MTTNMLSSIFSELKEAFGIFKCAQEAESANMIGVMQIAYSTQTPSHPLGEWQQGEEFKNVSACIT